MLNEIGGRCIWCAGGGDDTDLARAAQVCMTRGVPAVSVLPGAVGVMWPWLENTGVDIVARFYLDTRRDIIDAADDLTGRINAAFKSGAAGAQVFVRRADLPALARQVRVIRDDLFFNRDLSVGLDIADVAPLDWPGVFDALREVRASSLILAMTSDAGDKSDIVGRIYGCLDAIDGNFDGDLHFAFGGNVLRMHQAWRLIQKMRPQMAARARFFVNFTDEESF